MVAMADLAVDLGRWLWMVADMVNWPIIVDEVYVINVMIDNNHQSLLMILIKHIVN